MNRCKVICHMYVSLDGKIDGEYMEKEDLEESGNYYDELIWKLGNANGNGRNTTRMYFAHSDIDYSNYEKNEDNCEDNIIRSEYYWVVFDTNGKTDWDTNIVSYGSKTANVLLVLSKKVRKGYLSYLKHLNIAYILCGDKKIDLNLALEKLYKIFNIQTLVLCGGAIINGGFLKEDLIDEISLVVAPYIEGDKTKRNFIETNSFINKKFYISSFKKLDDGSLHLVYERNN